MPTKEIYRLPVKNLPVHAQVAQEVEGVARYAVLTRDGSPGSPGLERARIRQN